MSYIYDSNKLYKQIEIYLYDENDPFIVDLLNQDNKEKVSVLSSKFGLCFSNIEANFTVLELEKYTIDKILLKDNREIFYKRMKKKY